MAAIYSNGGNRWNILGFNFTKRDALSSVYKTSMVQYHMTCRILCSGRICGLNSIWFRRRSSVVLILVELGSAPVNYIHRRLTSVCDVIKK
jgi:hypothetical protein